MHSSHCFERNLSARSIWVGIGLVLTAAAASAQTFVSPVEGGWEETNPYARYTDIDGDGDFKYHAGLDLVSPTGSLIIRATAAGTVRTVPKNTYDNENHGMGAVVIIDHTDGSGLCTLYGHLSEITVTDGQTVSVGEQVGIMGETEFATGVHLHFEVKDRCVISGGRNDEGDPWEWTSQEPDTPPPTTPNTPEHPNWFGYHDPEIFLTHTVGMFPEPIPVEVLQFPLSVRKAPDPDALEITSVVQRGDGRLPAFVAFRAIGEERSQVHLPNEESEGWSASGWVAGALGGTTYTAENSGLSQVEVLPESARVRANASDASMTSGFTYGVPLEEKQRFVPLESMSDWHRAYMPGKSGQQDGWLSVGDVQFIEGQANPPDTIFVSGTIDSDETWGGNTVYVLTGDVTVPFGVVLTIEAGVEVQFPDQLYDLFVAGTLLAEGTAASPIRFVGSSVSEFGGRLFFEQTSVGSVLAHAEIEHMGYSSAALVLESSSVTVTNTVVTDSYYRGILVTSNAAPTISGTTVEVASLGIEVDSGSAPVIEDGVIRQTGSGLTVKAGSGAVVIGTTFEGNTTDVWAYPTSGFEGWSGNAFAHISMSGGTVSTSTTWPSTTGSPVYVLTGDVTVPFGVVLTIEAGVEVQFPDQLYDLFVAGTLLAEGTAASPIRFVGSSVSEFGGRLFFEQTSVGSVLAHAEIEHMGYSSAALVLESSSVTVTNTVVTDSYYRGILVTSNAAPTISGTTVEVASLGIEVDSGSAPVIEDGVICQTGSGLTVKAGSGAVVIGTTFEGNTTDVWAYPTSGFEGWSGNAFAHISMSGGTVSTSTTWPSTTGSPVYVLTGDVTVPFGVVLTIEAGVEVQFPDQLYDLFVAGTLLAEGTAASPIRFVGSSVSEFGGRLFFEQTSVGSVLAHAEIEHMGYSSAALVLESSSVTVTNTVVTDSYYRGILVTSNAAPTISGTTVEVASLGIEVDSGSAPVIEDGVIRQTGSGLTVKAGSGAVVIGTTFEGNTTDVWAYPTSGFEGWSGNAFAHISMSGGTVSTSTTWPSTTGSPVYVLTGDVTVPFGVVLTIEAGVEVQFPDQLYDLFVAGTLLAEGTAASPIRFVGSSVSEFGGRLFFEQTSVGSVLAHAEIEHMGYSSAALVLESSSVTVTNTVVTDSYYRGILVTSNAAPTIRNSTIIDNPSYGIYIDSGSPNLGTFEEHGQNNIYNNGGYDLFNSSLNIIYAIGNFWGFGNASSIDARIYDDDESASRGPVLFEPFSTEGLFENRYPSLYLSDGSISAGGEVTITGSDFTPDGLVRLYVDGPMVSDLLTVERTASASGTISYVFSTDEDTTPGGYSVYGFDETSNLTTSTRIFEVQDERQDYVMSVLSPSSGDRFTSGETIRVEWVDRLQPGNAYPVTGAQRSYSYTLELSMDGGGTWVPLATLEGAGELDRVVTLHRDVVIVQTGSEQLVRITDNFVPSRQGVSESFAVDPATATNLKVDLLWDYSYEQPTSSPKGVAADGVGRIYLRLSKIDLAEGEEVESVTVSLYDKFNSDARTLGKVMVATVTDQYSAEANEATETTVTDEVPARDAYWFWYVAPDDFAGADPDDQWRPLRYVTARFTVTYTDESQEVIERELRIVRPPLMFVHGLGGDETTWDEFRHGVGLAFIDDARFMIRKAVNLDKSEDFFTNAIVHLLSSSDSNPNSFRSTIKVLRSKGYAANRLDYICHSMGGSIAREAEKHERFYSEYNYGQGYINRLITISTPHLGSPLANLFVDIIESINYLPSFNREILWAMFTAYFYKLDNFFSTFVIPTVEGNFEPAEAILDLRAGEGVAFGTTPLKSHLLAADLVAGDQDFSEIPDYVWQGLENGKNFIDFVDRLLDISVFVNMYGLKDKLKEIARLTKAERIVRFLDLIFLEYTVNIVDSDVVVSVESQLAGLPRNTANVSVWDNLTHTEKLLYNPVLKSIDVGNQVNLLLNTSITDPVFASIPSGELQTMPVLAKSRLSTNQKLSHGVLSHMITSLDADTEPTISIITPTEGENVVVDSLMQVRIAVSDTVGLSYLKLYFQQESYVTTSKALIYTFDIQVGSTAIDSQRVDVVAIYDRSDATFFATDAIMVNVVPGASLERFSVSPLVMHLNSKQVKKPSYEAVFSNHISYIDNPSASLTATVDDPSIISFDPISHAFTGLSAGETFAVITYRGLADTVYFRVGESTADEFIASLDAKIFLEGPYDTASNQMQADLISEGYLPTVQPFSTDPWNYSGTESVDAAFFTAHPDLVDWVLLELRSDTDAASMVGRRAAFLKNDGTIVDISDGTSPAAFAGLSSGDYYVVVYHRNHLPVMSASPVTFNAGVTATYDFTTAMSQAFGTNAMVELEAGVFGLYAGDADASGGVTATDQVLWLDENGTAGYLSSDFNLSGGVTATDQVLWLANNGKSSQVP